MSKVITSPVERWPGTVTLTDPITFPQYAIIEDCLVIANGKHGLASYQLAMFPAILAVAEKWELGGDFPIKLTAENFPFRPKEDRNSLMNCLINEILYIFNGEHKDPND